MQYIFYALIGVLFINAIRVTKKRKGGCNTNCNKGCNTCTGGCNSCPTDTNCPKAIKK